MHLAYGDYYKTQTTFSDIKHVIDNCSITVIQIISLNHGNLKQWNLRCTNCGKVPLHIVT